jgi:hypothetical protein
LRHDGQIGFFIGKIKIPASAMGLQRAVLAHGGHRLNVFYFHWIPQRSLGNEACNTRTELSSLFEGVGSLNFTHRPKSRDAFKFYLDPARRRGDCIEPTSIYKISPKSQEENFL